MKITWYGQGCFQIILKEREQPQISIVVNPFDKEMKLKSPWSKADVLLISQKQGAKGELKNSKNNPFLINWPGEYEIKGVFVQGIAIPCEKDKELGKCQDSTIFTIKAEGLEICYLGPFSLKELTTKQLDDIGDIDILMVPTGGLSVLDSKQAMKIISQIEPKIVVPMYYQISGLKNKRETLKDFLKAFGAESVKAEKVMVVKEKDIPKEDETKVFALEP